MRSICVKITQFLLISIIDQVLLQTENINLTIVNGNEIEISFKTTEDDSSLYVVRYKTCGATSKDFQYKLTTYSPFVIDDLNVNTCYEFSYKPLEICTGQSCDWWSSWSSEKRINTPDPENCKSCAGLDPYVAVNGIKCSCFHFIDSKMNRENANKTCAINNGTLAVFETKLKIDAIKIRLKNPGKMEDRWIDGIIEDRYRKWYWESKNIFISTFDWAVNFSEEYSGRKSYLYLNKTHDYQWAYTECGSSDKKFVICEKRL